MFGMLAKSLLRRWHSIHIPCWRGSIRPFSSVKLCYATNLKLVALYCFFRRLVFRFGSGAQASGFGYGVGIVVAWWWHGSGMVVAWQWHGSGIVVAW